MNSDSDEEAQLIQDIAELRRQLHLKERELYNLKQKHKSNSVYSNGLTSSEVSRYSRQLMMPQIALSGQLALKNSRVLVVGAGGLGCPVSLYLVAAGVGELTIVDYDEVDLTNLHRQILHLEHDVGRPKVNSVYNRLRSLNTNVKIIPLKIIANRSTLPQLVSDIKYHVVVDCSDNVVTRYLLNDVCVLNKIPLVSGSALQMEGQLTVYNYKNGPCYRCLFPNPPPAEAVTNCGDGGVLGVVPGMIGVLQALETIKIIIGMEGVLSKRLLVFDGCDTTFRNVKLRQRSKDCKICGDNPTILEPVDYEQFCGRQGHDKVTDVNILNIDEHVDVTCLPKLFENDEIIVDVRSELEYQMCKLPKTINVPYSNIRKGQGLDQLDDLIKNKSNKDDLTVFVLCRRGNDSQRSVKYFKEKYADLPVKFKNIQGGLYCYEKLIDHTFPLY